MRIVILSVCMCLSASKIAHVCVSVSMCVCLVFAQIVRAKSCVNICVKNFSKRGLKTFTMLPGYSASEMVIYGGGVLVWQVKGGRGSMEIGSTAFSCRWLFGCLAYLLSITDLF